MVVGPVDGLKMCEVYVLLELLNVYFLLFCCMLDDKIACFLVKFVFRSNQDIVFVMCLFHMLSCE